MRLLVRQLGLMGFIGLLCWYLHTPPAFAADKAVIAPLASKSLLLDGAVLKSGRLVAVGARGHILLSDNQGESWRQVEVPTRATLTAVAFLDEKTGWAVGHDAVILKTRDSGESWEVVYSAPELEKPLLDIGLLDEKNPIAIGAYGLCLSPDGGGDNWLPRLVEEDAEQDAHLNRIIRADSGRLFIAAEGGRIYRSDDGAETWRVLPSPYEGSFFGVLPLQQDGLLLFGLRGNLFRSEDAGETWQQIKTGTKAMLNDGLRLSDGRLVIVGLGGTLLVSRDEGLHFTLVQQSDRKGISAVIPAGDGHLLLIGEAGVKRIPTDF